MITIAIADDHILLRKALISLINTFEHCKVIVEADNGRELIDLMQSAPQLPQVAILDVHMPFLDGYATAIYLNQHYPQVSTLTLSMLNDEAHIIKMLQAGVKGYLLKECQPEELKEALEYTARGEYYVNGLIAARIDKTGKFQTVAYSKPVLPEAEQSTFLTEREIEFLQWSASDYTYKEIADRMKLSPRTVDSYRDALFDKLQIRSRVGLAVYAIRNKLVTI